MSGKRIMTGWIEVLFRKADAAPVYTLDDLHPEDYEMVCGPLPLAEFDGLYDVFRMYAEPRRGLPRAMTRFDIVNLAVTSGPVFEVGTGLFINERTDKHLIFPRAQMEQDPGFKYPLTMMLLQKPFQSFRGNHA